MAVFPTPHALISVQNQENMTSLMGSFMGDLSELASFALVRMCQIEDWERTGSLAKICLQPRELSQKSKRGQYSSPASSNPFKYTMTGQMMINDMMIIPIFLVHNMQMCVFHSSCKDDQETGGMTNEFFTKEIDNTARQKKEEKIFLRNKHIF